MKVPLDLKSISEVDNGMIGHAVTMELKRATQDIKNRPLLDSPRKVTMTIDITPSHITNGDGSKELDGANFKASVTSSIPKRETGQYHANIDTGGQCSVNLASPNNANQHTLDEVG